MKLKKLSIKCKNYTFASDKSTSDMLRDYLLPLSEKENILEKIVLFMLLIFQECQV